MSFIVYRIYNLVYTDKIYRIEYRGRLKEWSDRGGSPVTRRLARIKVPVTPYFSPLATTSHIRRIPLVYPFSAFRGMVSSGGFLVWPFLFVFSW